MMCTADGSGCALAAPGGGFASVADALRVTRAAAAYLNSPAAADLEGAARGEALEQLGAITSLLGAAANGLLRRFDADYGHDADGYASAAAWLAAKNHLGRKDAKAAVRQMRLLGRHPSWMPPPPPARSPSPGRRRSPPGPAASTTRNSRPRRTGSWRTPRRPGRTWTTWLLAQAAYEAWRAQEPDPDDDPRPRASTTAA